MSEKSGSASRKVAAVAPRILVTWDGELVEDFVADSRVPVRLGPGLESLGERIGRLAHNVLTFWSRGLRRRRPYFWAPPQWEGPAHPLLEPLNGLLRYRAVVPPGVQAVLWRGGEQQPLQEGGATELQLGDRLAMTFGRAGLVVEMVPAGKPPRPFFAALEPSLLSSLALSAFFLTALLVVAFLERREYPDEGDLELPPDLVAKFLVVPPPEDILEEAGDEAAIEDPGLRRDEEMGGKAHEGDEGRVGREDAEVEQTHIQGEVREQIAARVRQVGLLGALAGGPQGNAIAAALDVPTVSDILGGMGAAPTVVGRGSRGAGLRGTGRGGGGDGPGVLFGAGKMGTGFGAGRGGMGRGRGGVGVKGRPGRGERRVSVSTGRPRTTGRCQPAPIQRVVRTHASAIRYCYEVEVQRQPGLKGRVEVTWRIDGSGNVRSVRVGRSTLRNRRVEGCITRQVRRWRFPKPEEGECMVTYPFLFGVSGGR